MHTRGPLAPQKLSSLTAFQTSPLYSRASNCRERDSCAYRCLANASARPGRKSKHPVAQPNPKSFGKPGSFDKPGSFGKPQPSKRQQPKQPDQQEAADLAFLRQQKASNASKKVLRVSGLQRAAALRGHSPTAEPFYVALSAHKVGLAANPHVSAIHVVTWEPHIKLNLPHCNPFPPLPPSPKLHPSPSSHTPPKPLPHPSAQSLTLRQRTTLLPPPPTPNTPPTLCPLNYTTPK